MAEKKRSLFSKHSVETVCRNPANITARHCTKRDVCYGGILSVSLSVCLSVCLTLWHTSPSTDLRDLQSHNVVVDGV